MQVSVAVAVALAGLGCQNKSSDQSAESPALISVESAEANAYPRYTNPSSYSGFYTRNENGDVSDVYASHWDAAHATIWSFLVGRDPGVTTAAEIEASVYGDTVEGHESPHAP